MPVEAGELRTRWGVSETNRVPRSRSSSTTGGRPDGPTVDNSGNCVTAFGRRTVWPAGRPASATTRPPALKAHFTAGLLGGPRTAVRTRETRRVRRRFVGFTASHTPEYNPK